MAKFKVGDKVVIKDNFNGHGFQMGDVVVISVVHSDGYRGHKIGDDPEEWWAFEDSEIEEYKEGGKVQEFKIGDRVRMVKKRAYSFDRVGMTGTIIDIRLGRLLEIEVDEKEPPMDGGGWTYWVEDENWELIKEEPKLVQKEKPKTTVLKLDNYKIIFNGDTTVVTDGVRKGVAKRHPDDEYDAVVGLQVALERFHGGRKPKIGDKVKVLKVDMSSRYGCHNFGEGDIVEVVRYGHIDTDLVCNNDRKFQQTLIAGEYEVLG